MRAAQRTLWEELRVIAEPAGATGLAALLSGAYTPAPGERVALELSADSARALIRNIEAALAKGEAEHALAQSP